MVRVLLQGSANTPSTRTVDPAWNRHAVPNVWWGPAVHALLDHDFSPHNMVESSAVVAKHLVVTSQRL